MIEEKEETKTEIIQTDLSLLSLEKKAKSCVSKTNNKLSIRKQQTDNLLDELNELIKIAGTNSNEDTFFSGFESC